MLEQPLQHQSRIAPCLAFSLRAILSLPLIQWLLAPQNLIPLLQFVMLQSLNCSMQLALESRKFVVLI